jgi:hypothetical protein
MGWYILHLDPYLGSLSTAVMNKRQLAQAGWAGVLRALLEQHPNSTAAVIDYIVTTL